MSTTSNTEVQELKEFIQGGFNQLDKDINNKFNELDKKIDNKFNELDKKIDNKFNEVEKGIVKLEAELGGLDKRVSSIETSVQKIPEITEKFGELKNWRQIAFVIIAAIFGWFARSGKI